MDADSNWLKIQRLVNVFSVSYQFKGSQLLSTGLVIADIAP